MSDSTDAALAAEGDYPAFERLFERYLSRIYSLCVRLSGSRERGAELTEDVFVRAWEELPRFRGESPFAAWLHRLATDVILSAGEAYGEIAPSIEQQSERLDLDQGLDRLPADARKVVVLHDVEGFKHEEIAEILGITVGGSKARLRRARVLLKEALGR
ncbi:MAG TPA: RNA polymerase sigma factor [Gemmatimonadaceae bacterium]|jgi:RNA polymerase sigma-70 factor (ECF subfamily)|nr:RNA polymerase sigma factor [Gemmatimonadaceae bacterium]